MTSANQTTYDETTKIWSGVKSTGSYGPEQSVGSVVLAALQKDPDHILQICYPTDKAYTNKEILKLSISVALYLEKLQIEQSEIVGICAANSDFLAPLVFGCMFRGLTISTLDPSFNKDEIRHMCSITKPKLMFCDGSVYRRVKEALDECNLTGAMIYTVVDDIDGIPKLTDLLMNTDVNNEFKCVPLKMGYNQVAVITCSSGTTGLYKGVCVSHAALLNLFHSTNMPPGERIFGFSTLYWISGIIWCFGSAIYRVTRIITNLTFSPEVMFEIVQHHKITIFLGSPSQLGLITASSRLQQYDLSSLKYGAFIGGALPMNFVNKFKEIVPHICISVSYGMSETVSAVSSAVAIENGNCGQLKPNFEVKIIDDNGQNSNPNETGEIYARSLYPWAGYYGNPVATADMYDSEGWIHSGDLGYVDNKGALHVIDRIKDISKYNNYHYSPTEIEQVILKLKDVVEVCVFAKPDIIYSSLPTAAIVKVTGSALTEDKVCQHVADLMVHFKHLRGGVFFVNELPKTQSGKILRRKVMELCSTQEKIKEKTFS